MVVAMARNGTDFGIQTSGTGDQWFTGPADTPVGLFLGNYGPEDANPDIGDCAIMETAGMGGFAMAAAPAIVRFVGGDVPLALRTTRTMYEITLGESIPHSRSRYLSSVAHQPELTALESYAQASCPRSTPVWRGPSPAPARSAPAWSTRRRNASPPHFQRWRKRCRIWSEWPGSHEGERC